MKKVIFSVFVLVLISFPGFSEALISQNDLVCGRKVGEWISRAKSSKIQIRENAISLLGGLLRKFQNCERLRKAGNSDEKARMQLNLVSSPKPDISPEIHELITVTLLEISKDPDERLRSVIIRSLGYTGSKLAFNRLFEMMQSDNFKDDWTDIYLALCQMGELASESVPLIVQRGKVQKETAQFIDEDERVNFVRLIQVLGEIKDPRSFDFLCVQAKGKNQTIQANAVKGILKISAENPNLLERTLDICTLLLRSGEQKESWWIFLGSIGDLGSGAKKLIPDLLPLLEEGNERNKIGTIKSLGTIAEKTDTQVIQALLSLQSDRSEKVRNEALMACLRIQDGSLVGEIHLAVKAGNIEKIKELLGKSPALLSDQGSDDEMGLRFSTPLAFAVRGNQKASLKTLLEYKGSLNDANGMGQNSIRWLIERDNDEFLSVFLDSGIPIKDEWLFTAVGKPIWGDVFFGNPGQALGSPKCARLLISRGANINAKDPESGRSPLFFAVELAHPELVEILLKSGADPNFCDNENLTPILLSKMGEFDDLSDLFVKYGAKSEDIDVGLSFVMRALAYPSNKSSSFFNSFQSEWRRTVEAKLASDSAPFSLRFSENLKEEFARLKEKGENFRKNLNSDEEKYFLDFNLLIFYFQIGHLETVKEKINLWKGFPRACLVFECVSVQDMLIPSPPKTAEYINDLVQELSKDSNHLVASKAKELLNRGKPKSLLGKMMDFPEGLKSLDGATLSMDRFKGKVVLVDFWATWCGPCVAKVPELVKLYRKFSSKGFEIIGISLDNKIEEVEKFTKIASITWPMYFDGKGWKNVVSSKFGIESIPQTFLIDKKGIVVLENPDEPALERQIEVLLKSE